MSTSPMPAASLAAVPGRRHATIALGRELEARGFAGIYCPSFGDGLGLCQALAIVTDTIPLGTAIVPIYTRHPSDFAHTSALVQELSGGRFRFGIGVSHGPVHERLGVRPGKPLADVKRFIQAFKATPNTGTLPPIVLAALRDQMVALAGSIADGLVFANGARSRMTHSLGLVPDGRRRDPGFFIGNMIPTCIAEDERAAAAVHRRTLTRYVALPNYRNYWKEAGYVDEMTAIEQALAAGEEERLPQLMSDRWLADCTLFGPAVKVREGVEAWIDAGVRTPILVPSSASGNQMRAFEELFAAYR